MTDLVQSLYCYCSESVINRYLTSPEYQISGLAAERAENALKEVLPDERLLRNLRDAWSNCTSLEMEAFFQAGLAMGLELSRL